VFASSLRTLANFLLIAIALASVQSAFAGDRDKADKRLRQISAMAADPTARAIINRTLADFVHAKPIELQRQRHAMNLSYGSLFIAHQLTNGGARMLDIALELQNGKTIFDVANERNASWKQIAEEAKKLEDRIEENIYRRFLHSNTAPPAPDEKYDVEADLVKADQEFSVAEIADARAVYVFWRNRAAGPRSKSLDPTTASIIGKSADTWDKGDRH
jgi:hypothetical protein